MIKSENSIVNELISYLRNNGGSASPADVCRDIMGLDNCDASLAARLMRQGLPADHRLAWNAQGEIVLAKRLSGKQKSLTSESYAVIDIEATSLPKPDNRIMEFAAVKLDDGRITESYSTLINPTVAIPGYVQQMTGIRTKMVKDQPEFEQIAEEIMEFLGDRVMVAHNIAFDAGIINSELRRAGMGLLGNKTLCTVKLSRKLVPGLDRYRLGEVASYFGIEIENRHRAVDDAVAAARIFLKVLNIAEEKNIKSLKELFKIGGVKSNAKW